jgi:hypothetical protein
MKSSTQSVIASGSQTSSPAIRYRLNMQGYAVEPVLPAAGGGVGDGAGAGDAAPVPFCFAALSVLPAAGVGSAFDSAGLPSEGLSAAGLSPAGVSARRHHRP